MENNTALPLLTMDDVARALTISKSFAYKLIQPPHNLPAVKIGGVWRVDRAKFQAWCRSLQSVEPLGDGDDAGDVDGGGDAGE